MITNTSAHCRFFSAVVILSLLLPNAAAAIDTWGLGTSGNAQLGEFLKGAFEALQISPGSDRGNAELFKGTPRSLVPYFSKAYSKGALETVSNNIRATRTVTRGTAAFILATLADKSGEGLTGSYRDAKAGSPLEAAIRVAVKEGWMRPLRPGIFGSDRSLSRRDAIKILNAVSGRTTKKGTEKTIEQNPATPVIKITVKPKTRTPKSDLLDAVWEIIQRDYLREEGIDPDAASYGAIEAIVQSLKDPYSAFYKPSSAEMLRSRIQGEVTGIGAQVEQKNGVLTIVSPLRGSPAEKAGLQAGDEILMADDVSLAGLDFIQSVEKVRGPKGSTVKLRIRRSGAEFDISVTRDTVSVSEIDISWQENVAIVQLMQFGERTQNTFRSEMQKIQEKNPKGVILDLRNNPGGLLNAATIVLSNFLPQGSQIALIKARKEEHKEVTGDAPTLLASTKLMVLVNGGSASASEIVAGALQDANRATLIGEKTFGKGTVQEVVQFNDKSSLKLTIAEWFTPLGRKIDGAGVEPDVKATSKDGRDEPMLKALELLR